MEDDMEDDFEDGSPTMTMAAYCAEQGLDHRQFDYKNYACLRRSGYGLSAKAAIYASRETLTQPLRIERLRWKAYLNFEQHFVRHKALAAELEQMPDQECFIPSDLTELQEWKEKRELEGEPLTEEEIDIASRPRRVSTRTDSRDGSVWSSYDDDFWDYREPTHCGTDLEVLAVAGALGEWEQITKPDRIARSQDPAKLDLGRRWKHEVSREWALRDKCHILNTMLSSSIINSDLLPVSVTHGHQRVRVHLNDRVYYFKTGQGGYKQDDSELWPTPGDLADVIITGPISVTLG